MLLRLFICIRTLEKDFDELFWKSGTWSKEKVIGFSR